MTVGSDDPDWEDLGRHLLARRLFSARSDVEDAFYDLEDAVRDGEPITAADVRAARDALSRALRVIEDETVPFAEGEIEPWERPPDAPYGKMRAWVDRDGCTTGAEADR